MTLQYEEGSTAAVSNLETPLSPIGREINRQPVVEGKANIGKRLKYIYNGRRATVASIDCQVRRLYLFGTTKSHSFHPFIHPSILSSTLLQKMTFIYLRNTVPFFTIDELTRYHVACSDRNIREHYFATQ